MRTRPLTSALVAAPLVLTLLAGCGPVTGTAAETAATGPSAGLRTAEPAPMSTVDSVAAAIAAGASTPTGAVGRVSRDDATAAIEWLGTYLAQAHGDPAWLCATETIASPSRRYGTSVLLKRFAGKDGEAVRHGLEPQIAKKGDRDCSGVDWVAPGVAVGPQRMTLQPGRNGDDLRVVYRGVFGYRLVAKDGREQPWGGDYRVTYGLVQHGREWRLNSVGSWWYSVGLAWPDPLPLPAGYADKATAPALPDADEASLTAVREAVRGTLAAPAATWSYTEVEDQRGTRSTSQTKGTVAFVRGDALIRRESGGTPSNEIYLDDGRTDLNPLTRPVAPVPGESMPQHPQWRTFDPARRPVILQGVGDSSPFVNLAIVGLADAAAKATCPAGAAAVRADRCYTVRVPVSAAAYGDGITSAFGWGHLVLGDVWLTMDVGTDAAGRLVYLHRKLDITALGQDWTRAELTGTLTGFTDKLPVVPTRPAAKKIARDGTFYYPD